MTQHAILDSNTHRALRVRSDAGRDLGDGVMGTLTVPSEFRNVQGHFPILFRREVGRDDFFAVALFGFENGENLFLDGDRWDARYRPLSLAIQFQRTQGRWPNLRRPQSFNEKLQWRKLHDRRPILPVMVDKLAAKAVR